MAPITRSMTGNERPRKLFISAPQTKPEKKTVRAASKSKNNTKVRTTAARVTAPESQDMLRLSGRMDMETLRRIAASAVVEIVDLKYSVITLDSPNTATTIGKQAYNNQRQKKERKLPRTVKEQTEVKSNKQHKAVIGVGNSEMVMAVVHSQEGSAAKYFVDPQSSSVPNVLPPLHTAFTTERLHQFVLRCPTDSILTYFNGSGSSGIPISDFNIRRLIRNKQAGPLMVDSANDPIQFPNDIYDDGNLPIIGYPVQETVPANDSTFVGRNIFRGRITSLKLSRVLAGQQEEHRVNSVQVFSLDVEDGGQSCSFSTSVYDETGVGVATAAFLSSDQRFRSVLSDLDYPPPGDNSVHGFRHDSMGSLQQVPDVNVSLNQEEYERILAELNAALSDISQSQ